MVWIFLTGLHKAKSDHNKHLWDELEYCEPDHHHPASVHDLTDSVSVSLQHQVQSLGVVAVNAHGSEFDV